MRLVTVPALADSLKVGEQFPSLARRRLSLTRSDAHPPQACGVDKAIKVHEWVREKTLPHVFVVGGTPVDVSNFHLYYVK